MVGNQYQTLGGDIFEILDFESNYLRIITLTNKGIETRLPSEQFLELTEKEELVLLTGVDRI